MKLRLIYTILFTVITFFLFPVHKAQAVENPFSSFNNKFGVHILFPSELASAAKLVNSNGGDWGYVIIPIQSNDMSREKWQNFMDDAKKLHVIPILRLATEGDNSNTKVWRKPTESDVVDFANFLNSLNWPVKNRYIVVFNEVNRGDERGGRLNVDEYTHILSYAIDVFKSKSADFFMINAGLDNAAPGSPPLYENEYTFLREMNNSVPGIFNKLDGFASHSYPNPAFSQPPTSLSSTGISSFVYERKLIKTMTDKNLPVFITETGWSGDVLSDAVRAAYFKNAFNNAWSDIGIVAITPFILNDNGSFTEFSLINNDGGPTLQYDMLKSLPKVRGMPALVQKSPVLLNQQRQVLGLAIEREISNKESETKKFSFTDELRKVILWISGN
jgi:hypothetical protein